MSTVKSKKKLIAIVALIVFFVISFVILLNAVIIPNRKFNDAVSLMADGKYKESIKIFIELGEYKDSVNKIEEIVKFDPEMKIYMADIGDYICFGSYEQDNNTSNGKEDMEWLVLDKENDKMLVISKYAIDCENYNLININETYKDLTWETCFLRKWLNDNFINQAFTEEQKSRLLVTNVSADKSSEYDINTGNATQDKVFLLSISEANKYFTSDEARKCIPTAYTLDKKAYKSANGSCIWWLRSPGHSQIHTAVVRDDGSVDMSGTSVNNISIAVRPAMWIALE